MNIFEAVENCKSILKDNIVGSVRNVDITKISKSEEGYHLWYLNPVTGAKNCVVLEGVQDSLEYLYQVELRMKDFVATQEADLVWRPIPGYSNYAMTATRPNTVRSVKKNLDLKAQKAGNVYRIVISGDTSYKATGVRLDDLHRLTFPELYAQ